MYKHICTSNEKRLNSIGLINVKLLIFSSLLFKNVKGQCEITKCSLDYMKIRFFKRNVLLPIINIRAGMCQVV